MSGELSERLERAVDRVLDNDQWRLEYMHLEVRDYLNRKEGRVEGEECLAALIKALMASGRTADVEKALEDASYRADLYRELDIVRDAS